MTTEQLIALVTEGGFTAAVMFVFIWLVCKYLPKRDEQFLNEMKNMRQEFGDRSSNEHAALMKAIDNHHSEQLAILTQIAERLKSK